MTWEAWLTAACIVAMVGTLIATRFGADLVLLGVLGVLLLAGVITPGEAAAGFGNPAVITVGFLYVVACGLKETGATRMLTTGFLGEPTTERGALLRIVGPVTAMSAFLNNTPIVAMFMPTVSEWCRRNKLNPARLFMPLSFAAILGGLCTLIGTSTNLVVAGLLLTHNASRPEGEAPLETFGMFTLAPVGIPVALVGIAYIFLFSKALLPKMKEQDERAANPREYMAAMKVPERSPLVGQTIEQARLRHLPGLFLSRIERDRETVLAVSPEETLEANDTLVFVGNLESMVDLQQIRGLQPVGESERAKTIRQLNRLSEVVISRSSPIAGRSIRDAQFRSVYGGVVLAVHRQGARVRGKLGDIVLRPGDTLLVEAPRGWADQHRSSDAFHMVSEVSDESAAPRYDRAWAAIAIMLGVVVSITAGWLDTMTASIAGAAGMVLLRCCTGPQARRSVDWSVLLVIAAAFGLGKAMENTGLADFLAHNLLGWTAEYGALAIIAGCYIVTVLFTSLITNNAAAILIFPIALELWRSSGTDIPFLPIAIAVAIGASAEFSTPIGYQTNLMVMGPGRYRWIDYTRFGGPLMLLAGAVAIFAAWLVYA